MQKDNPLYESSYNTIKKSALFRSLNSELLHKILEKFTIYCWKKNETIDYELCDKYCFFIVEGRIKMTQVDPKTGRSIAPFLLSSGDIFDVITLLDEKEHIVFPITIDNIVALAMPLNDARELISKYPQLNQQFLPYLGKLMRHLEEFGTSMVFYDTVTRLANLILKHTFSHKDSNTKEHKVKLINNLSHESIAELVGSVRSVITLQLQKLKDEDIILHKRGEIAISNLEKLIRKIDHLHCKK